MKIVIDELSVNTRIDKYLSENTEYSRSMISKLIEMRNILVNGNNIKASYKLKENDKITIDENYKFEETIEAEPMNLNIIYEDKYLMIINKPSGMVVHPGNGNTSKTLVNGLMHYTSTLSDVGGEVRPGIVHRIDKDTSGLMIVAKTNETHEKLTNMFSKKEIHREYIALIKGAYKHDSADIDAPIGRDKNDRQKMCVTDFNAKEAVTHFKVLKRYKNFTLINLVLETGRTHQIRVHLNYIGYPVYNDPVYTKDKCSEFGQFLHSSYIKFKHPITEEIIEFSCNLPDEFQKFIDTLEESEIEERK